MMMCVCVRVRLCMRGVCACACVRNERVCRSCDYTEIKIRNDGIEKKNIEISHDMSSY